MTCPGLEIQRGGGVASSWLTLPGVGWDGVVGGTLIEMPQKLSPILFCLDPKKVNIQVWIQPNLAEMWSQACNHIVFMRTSLPAWVKLYVHGVPACSLNPEDTLISLI